MTTKPKARKFRIKRSPTSIQRAGAAPAANAATARPAPMPDAHSEPRKAGQHAQPIAPADVASAAQVANEGALEAIRREGLTARQLRIARRVAQKHNLPVTSDLDAVRQLRAKGIDPFKRSTMLELVVQKEDGHPPGTPDGFESLPAQPHNTAQKMPQTVPPAPENLPAHGLSPAQRREQEVSDIQRQITIRRRKKLGLLLMRLAFFVALPTFLAGWYFYVIATPMYGTKSEFLIIQSEGSGGAGPLGGLLPTQFATNSDAIATQSYLQSKDAMLRLDTDLGFKAHFTQDWIDPIQRLTPAPTNEEAYKTYKKNVKIGYDPTEGVIRMEVVAADPEVSAEFSRRLIGYAEERVNNLSQQKREDQMRDAREGFEQAEADRRSAQEALVKLQVETATLDPEAVIAALRVQITNTETLLLEKELERAALLDNARPNRAKVDGVEGDIRRLNAQLFKLNTRMTEASVGENSLAQMAVNLQLAQADLASRDMMLQSALQQMEQARVEASRQVRYLTVAVKPVASQEATYPRAFENTILAFLIFGGIYLMISLTASILREQVTS